MFHFPVLLRETTNLLNLQPVSKVIDGTLGDGGHAQAIIKRVSSASHLLAIDLDPENIERAKKNQELAGAILVNDNFRNLKKIVEKYKFGPINAILLDLGWSRTQFETSGRGFSFLKDEPLDMRYNKKFQISNFKFQINSKSQIPNPSLTAAKILNEWSEEEIGRILREYGEERNWREIARAIVKSREKQPIKTTNDLVKIIHNSKFIIHNSRLHPATQTFQSLRVAVNDELNALKEALPQAGEILAPGGRLAVISFHSLEDRIVKRFFQEQAKRGVLKIITKKPITAARAEIRENPSSRSAKLRVAEKI